MLARANGSTLGHVLLGSLILFSTSTEAMYGTSKGFLLNTYKDYMIFTTYGFEKGGYIELTSHITLTDGSTSDPVDDEQGDGGDGGESQRLSSGASESQLTDAQLNNGTLLLVCTPQYMQLMLSTIRHTDVCSPRHFVGCSAWRYLSQPYDYEHVAVFEEDSMQLAVVNCAPDPVRVLSLQWLLMNPDGEHLATGYQPLPNVYIAYLLIWLALALLQGANCVLYRHLITDLHMLMFAVPFFKIMEMLLTVLYWQQLSATGKSMNVLVTMEICAVVFAKLALFMVLLLLAKGWFITRRELPFTESQGLLISVAALVGIFTVYQVLRVVSFLALISMYTTVLAIMATSVKRSVSMLRDQMHLLLSVGVDVSLTPLPAKALLFRSLQVSMFMFVTAKVFIEVTTMLMDAKPWMRHFLAELSEAALWSAVAYTFRLAHPDVFAVVPPPPPPPTLVQPFAGEAMSPSVPHIQAMHPGFAASSLMPHERLGIVVVENPCRFGDGRNVIIGKPVDVSPVAEATCSRLDEDPTRREPPLLYESYEDEDPFSQYSPQLTPRLHTSTSPHLPPPTPSRSHTSQSPPAFTLPGMADEVSTRRSVGIASSSIASLNQVGIEPIEPHSPR